MSEEASRAGQPPPWRRLGSEAGEDLMIFRSRFDLLENPRTGGRMRRVVLETPDWVNVMALTPERRMVMVRQYRFGRRSVTLEIPGGMVDPGESPEEAARRELLEESGFEAGTWSWLGSVEPNPAFQDNLCHHWLAEDAVAVREPAPDAGEDLRVELLTLEQVGERVHRGVIRHSLVVCALRHLLDLRSPPPGPEATDGPRVQE